MPSGSLLVRVFAVCLGTLLVVAASPCAGATPKPESSGPVPAKAALDVQRGPHTESCLSASALARNVDRRLKRRVFDAAAGAELQVRVTFEKPAAWTARIVLSDRLGVLGTRELSTSARHCSALDDSLALIVALLVDTPPERPQDPPPPGPQPVAEPSVAPAVRVPHAATPLELPAETVAPREPFEFDARASLLLAAGALPGLVAPGVELAFGVKPRRAPWLRILGELYAPRERLDDGVGVRLSVVRLGLELCGALTSLGSAVIDGCVGQRLARVGVQGLRFDENRETSRFQFSLSAGGSVSVPLSTTLGVTLGLRSEIPFTRDQFTGRTADDQEKTVFQPSPIAAVAAIGFRLQL